MHPGFYAWWRARRDAVDSLHECASGCGPRGFGHSHHHHRGDHGAWASPHFDEGGVFGVRRPLRFLAYKLALNEEQVSVLAAVLDELKTERAQAAVDQRRRISALAEAVESAAFDEQRLANAGEDQQKSEQRIHNAVAAALRKIHALLDDEQKKRLAYLLRTGALQI
ncbi:MAG TPA: Spy/CpxP family protein refolding chaperone [Polyangiales bacterium]